MERLAQDERNHYRPVVAGAGPLSESFDAEARRRHHELAVRQFHPHRAAGRELRSIRVVNAPFTAYVMTRRSRSPGELAMENTRDSGQKASGAYGSSARCRN